VQSSALCGVLLLVGLAAPGCQGQESKGEGDTQASAQSGDDSGDGGATQRADAGARPTSTAAAQTLRKFVRAIEADDMKSAMAELRVPEDLDDVEVEGFLMQLVGDGHLSAEGHRVAGKKLVETVAELLRSYL